MQKNFLKKIAAFALVFTAVSVLFGCGSENEGAFPPGDTVISLSDDGIISDYSEEETALRMRMAKNAKTKVFLCDETKLGKGKDLVDTVSGLIGVFQDEDLDFSNNRAADDDLIGDAYEYLMKNFATESGKSKGQFYTPAEVSRVMAKVIGLNRAKNGKRSTIYDPTC